MKKVLVLALVLGVVGLANASLSMSVDKFLFFPENPVTITISSTTSGTNGGWLAYLQVEPDGVGVLSNPVSLNYGDKSAALPYSDSAGIGYEITTASTTGSLVSGPQWTFQLSCTTWTWGCTTVVDLWDDAVGYNTPVASLMFCLVPEPATMLLLGLGGLFIRRK